MSKTREDESNKAEQAKPRRDRWQCKYLKGCAARGEQGIERWNKWRRRHIGTEILLERADLSHMDLRGVNLSWGHPKNPRRRVYYGLGSSGRVYLRGAVFDYSDIRDAHFALADLRNSHFMDAKLEGACFNKSDLRGAYFVHATVDGSTLLWECPVNKYRKDGAFTDFSGVGLPGARVDPGTRQLLEYNVRRLNWEQWYVGDKAKKPFGKVETKMERASRVWGGRLRLIATSPVRCFWSITDYGRSTGRIIASFFILAFAFALIYWIWPQWLQGIRPDHDWRSFVHAIYFSVVTMTTLGFGDIAAHPDSWQGQVLLMVQVILGYVLLGALVTRFAVLFTAGGPAGRFAEGESVTSDK